jgi:hypothetical protein
MTMLIDQWAHCIEHCLSYSSYIYVWAGHMEENMEVFQPHYSITNIQIMYNIIIQYIHVLYTICIYTHTCTHTHFMYIHFTMFNFLTFITIFGKRVTMWQMDQFWFYIQEYSNYIYDYVCTHMRMVNHDQNIYCLV